jgi:ubiquinone/menaquinone biosynthesis C-methylase UbiE
MLPRILEPEMMDIADDAREYDAMDHTTVNALFVSDLLSALNGWSLQRSVPQRATLNILDLGAGTAQIPIELARRATNVHITAVDAAESMLAIARENVAAANLMGRITLILADAKNLAGLQGGATVFDHPFDAVISNSIFHHIPVPQEVIVEAIGVTATGGLLFHRDLARPAEEATLQQLVTTYARESTQYQRRLFTESLHAALTVGEMRDLVAMLGYDHSTVQMTSDRHWTWSAVKAQR